MKGPTCVQVATHIISVECNKNNIHQLLWYQLQACIGQRPSYWFLHDEHIILHIDKGLTQWSRIVVIDLC